MSRQLRVCKSIISDFKIYICAVPTRRAVHKLITLKTKFSDAKYGLQFSVIMITMRRPKSANVIR